MLDTTRLSFRNKSMTLSKLLKGIMIATVLSCTLNTAWAQTSDGLRIAPDTHNVTFIDKGPDAGAYKLDASLRQVDSEPMPIQGGKRYELNIKARLDSLFVVEKNDRAALLTLESFRFARTSTYELIFLNQNNEEISHFAYGGRGFFLTANWYQYTMAFYTPADATSMKIIFRPAKRTTYVRDGRLEELKDQTTINLNPDFHYGELNYAGWRTQREGLLLTRPDGKVIFRAGYGGGTSVFPLDPQSTYRIVAKGSGRTINMVYYNEAGKQLNSRFLTRPSANGDTSAEFTPPEGTCYGRLVTYGVTALESCEIVKVSTSAQ